MRKYFHALILGLAGCGVEDSSVKTSTVFDDRNSIAPPERLERTLEEYEERRDMLEHHRGHSHYESDSRKLDYLIETTEKHLEMSYFQREENVR